MSAENDLNMASYYASWDQFEPERARESWSTEQLKPRPGFGFYPDYVWDALEGFTQDKGDKEGVDIRNFSIPHIDLFRCSVLNHTWQFLFPGLYESGLNSVCPPMWDKASCIPPVFQGETAVFPCMQMYDGTRYYARDNATRACLANGTWANKTDYDFCAEMTPDPNQEPEIEISVHVYFIGYSISLLALIFALCIFLSFREMRCLRHKIHIGLFLTYIFTDLAWILTSLLQAPMMNDNSEEENISIFVVWCTIRNMLNYFHLTTFFWMFLEGLYLFLQVQVPLSLANIKHKHFLIVGWGVPGLVILVWGLLRMFLENINPPDEYQDTPGLKKVNRCPFYEDHSVDFPAYKMPVLVLLLANCFFLVWIMVIVVSKLRAQTVMEYDRKHWKAAKALIVIIPLLGITYLLTFSGPDKVVYPRAYLVFQCIRAFLLSTQGFVITLPYCFLNSEVRSVVNTRWERWMLVRSVGADSIRNSTAIMLKTRIDLTPTTGYSTYFTSLDPRSGGQHTHTQQQVHNHTQQQVQAGNQDPRFRSKLLNVPVTVPNQDGYDYTSTNGSNNGGSINVPLTETGKTDAL